MNQKLVSTDYYLKNLLSDKSPKATGNSNIVSSARDIKTINISDMTDSSTRLFIFVSCFVKCLCFLEIIQNVTSGLHILTIILKKGQKNKVDFFDVSASFVTKTAYLIRCTFGSLKSNGDKS